MAENENLKRGAEVNIKIALNNLKKDLDSVDYYDFIIHMKDVINKEADNARMELIASSSEKL